MSDPVIQTPRIQQDLEDSLAQLSAARDLDKQNEWKQANDEAAKKAGVEIIGGVMGVPAPVVNWMRELPRNVSVGTLDAAINTADALKHGYEYLQHKNAEGKSAMAAADNAARLPGTAPAEVPPVPEQPAPSPVYDAAKNAVLQFRNYLASNSDTKDEVTQTIAQYAVPFLGYSKLIGGLKGANALGTIARSATAEALTASTVLAPHDPRMTDILQLGKHVEGKFGEAMNAVAPDGSLLNAYIDYMSNRDNESEAEGRFKNVVDNLTFSAAIATLFKTGAVLFKGGHAAFNGLPDTASKSVDMSIGPTRQVGAVNPEVFSPSSTTSAQTSPSSAASIEPNHNGQFTDSFRSEHYVPPGSTVVTTYDKNKPNGLLAMKENESGALQISNAVVEDATRGTGKGKELLLTAAKYAREQGKPMVSDSSVTVNQLRVYESLKKSGKLNFEYSDPAKVEAALKQKDGRVPVKGPGGEPVVKNISLVEK